MEGVEVINPLGNWELLHNYLHLDRNDYPIAERTSKKTISVPIYPSLPDKEVGTIKKAIRKIYG
jgi:dTDP-4-amino-4,6-dideoxygalactose transaminase